MTKPKNAGRGRPPGKKTVRVIQVRADPATAKALEALARKNRRTHNAELLIALEKHLRDNGLLPPDATA